jgi:hypothetical protein
VCFAHRLLSWGRAGTGFARAAGICVLVRQVLRAKNAKDLHKAMFCSAATSVQRA